MKMRTGFVSNSSSSSFLLYGIGLDSLRELYGFDPKSIGMELTKEQFQEDIEEYGEELYDICEKLGLNWENMDGGAFYIGNSWDKVKNNETGAEFKQRTRTAVRKILPFAKDEDFKTHEEAWSDG